MWSAHYGYLIVALQFCGGCSSAKVGVLEGAIRGGALDNGDPAVAALSIAGLLSYCSATLIAPHTLLTAGHCNLLGAEAEFGTQADSPTQSITIADVAVHPMYTAEGKPYDFALMKLSSNPAGVTPVPLNGAPLTDTDVGQPIRHVGFGVTDDSTNAGGGTKRTVSYPLNQVDPVLIYSGAPGEQTCAGDSGGPGLMLDAQGNELLVGVVSDGPNCDLSEDGWDDRVDAVKDWIEQTVSGWDSPPTVVTTDGGLPASTDGGANANGTPDAAGNGPTAQPHAGGCALGGLEMRGSLGTSVLFFVLLLRLAVRRAHRRSGVQT